MRAIAELFPFTKYFANAPQPIFKGENFQQDWDIAEVYRRHNLVALYCDLRSVLPPHTGMLQTCPENIQATGSEFWPFF